MLLNKPISKTAGSVNCTNVVVLHKKTLHVSTINHRHKEVKADWTVSHVQDTVKKLQHRVADVADLDHLADMTYYTWLEAMIMKKETWGLMWKRCVQVGPSVCRRVSAFVGLSSKAIEWIELNKSFKQAWFSWKPAQPYLVLGCNGIYFLIFHISWSIRGQNLSQDIST